MKTKVVQRTHQGTRFWCIQRGTRIVWFASNWSTVLDIALRFSTGSVELRMAPNYSRPSAAVISARIVLQGRR